MNSILSRVRDIRISSRLILSIILVVFVTVSIGGMIGIGTIWIRLEQQLCADVQSAQTTTQALYQLELQHLGELTDQIAQNSTLNTLVQTSNLESLDAYLTEMQPSINIDGLTVVMPDQQRVGYAPIELPSHDDLFLKHELPFSDFFTIGDPPQLLVIAASEIQPSYDNEAEPNGWLITERVLNDDFMSTLALQTGLGQGLIVAETRIASSLGNPPDLPINQGTTFGTLCSGESCCENIRSESGEYFIGIMPLSDIQGNVVAFSEVDLPTESIRADALRAMAIVFALGLGLAVGGSFLAIMLTRNITQPMTSLAEAADRMGKGDLESPINIDSNLLEINQLAVQLESARRQLRHVQRATQREMNRIEHLLGSIREGVVAIDEFGIVTYFSPDAERILGYNVRNALQADYGQIFRPAPGAVVTIQDLLRNPEERPPVQYLSVLDAQDQAINIAVSISRLENDTPTHNHRELILVLRDVSEEEALNKLRCNFLANVAHEFRTPLAGVIASVELLSSEGADLSSGELAELVNTIRISTLNLQTLVDNILESATMEAGCFQVRRRMTDFRVVIQNAEETMKPILNRRKQRLDADFPDTPLKLWIDPDRLTQVLVNLLANASQYGSMGMPITISVQWEHDKLMVAVLDSGPGLPAGRYSDLFKRFFTGNHPRSAKYGIGLGLSVTKTIIEAHGGEVGAENRVEGGAKVWFTLPKNQPEVA